MIRYGAYKISPNAPALHLAVGFGWYDTAEALLANDHVDPNGRDALRFTSLHRISHCPSSRLTCKMIKVLIRHGADLDAAGSECPPLHWLTARGHFAYAHLLLKEGVCPDASIHSKDKATPLHLLWDGANRRHELNRYRDMKREDKPMLMRALIVCGNDLNATSMGRHCCSMLFGVPAILIFH